jgi:tetratricopeptide (TPR) repeat protein
MDAEEAAIYGEDVLELLTQARNTLVPKYQVELEEPIYVEIFPRQQEFAIRTFGLPGGAGFLGVCFGRLITANSPAALQVDSNWRSVLWHEYCHVVTLQKTKNKMPRWLSEGISVYEERLQDPTWGERLDPTYREMLLGDDLFPVSRLSSAFLSPKSPLHLQFAYYTSSLAVEFWIERFGIQGLQKLLEDLSIGMRPEEALARMPGSLEILDQEFLEYARAKAMQMAPHADFDRPSEEESNDIASWLETHPTSYWGQRRALAQAMERKEWESARVKAEQLIAMWPEDPSDEGIYWQLAIICRALGDVPAERDALVQLVSRASSPREGLLRLIEMDRERAAWSDVLRWCELLVGIQPINDVIQDYRSQAATQVADHDKALRALKAMVAMDPIDPAGVFFRMAQASAALKNTNQAKRYCLQALEESPRYREALELLVQLRPAVSRGR